MSLLRISMRRRYIYASLTLPLYMYAHFAGDIRHDRMPRLGVSLDASRKHVLMLSIFPSNISCVYFL